MAKHEAEAAEMIEATTAAVTVGEASPDGRIGARKKMPLRVVRIWAAALGGVLLMGGSCDTADLPKTADQLSKGITQSAASLAEGLKGIDPAGINKLLAENATLRENLDSIRRAANGLSLGQGVITLRERRLALRVPHTTGSFTVTAWVDDPQNWAWQNRRFVNQELVLPLNDHEFFVRDCLSNFNPASARNEAVCRGQFPHWAENVWGTIQRHTADEVGRAFRKFLHDAPLSPGPDTSLIEIGEARMTEGDHTISFEVTPVSGDSNGKWSFRGQLVVIAPNGSEAIVKEFDLLSERFSGHNLSSPLPLVTASIRVATAG